MALVFYICSVAFFLLILMRSELPMRKPHRFLPTTERPMMDRLDAQRVSFLALKVGCASQVISVMLTDILNYMTGPYQEFLGYQYLVAHVIWLARILALWVLRRSSSAAILYALSLAAILVSSLPEFLSVIYGHSAVPKQTVASLAAAAIGVVSLVVIFFWVLDQLMDLVFISIQRIVGVLRNG